MCRRWTGSMTLSLLGPVRPGPSLPRASPRSATGRCCCWRPVATKPRSPMCPFYRSTYTKASWIGSTAFTTDPHQLRPAFRNAKRFVPEWRPW
uniref:Putative secreted protein n=1 Tax=Anopheles darlingi TaxID=43151 RepID=A0A2M4DJD7_ANODA